MFTVKTYNTIAPIGLEQFPAQYYAIDPASDHPDAIILRSHVLSNGDIPKSVQVIGRAGAGTNNIPIEEMTKRGIPVLNTPGANANAVCEMVVAGLLLASRNICRAWEYVKQLDGDDQAITQQVEKQKKSFAGFEIAGRTLGIVGLGSVGTKVANNAIALGMNVIGYDPAITVSRAWELSSKVQKAHSVDQVLANADFVSLHVPLNDKTKGMINADKLKLAKSGIVLLNFSRDGIINNDDLLAALDEDKVHALVTDFPAEKLKNHPNTICLPHLGASTAEAEQNCAVMITKQIRQFAETGSILNSVNFPTVDVQADFNHTRVAVCNANVPNMVAQISECFAEAKCNIASLVNQSRGDVAYTLLDIDDEVNEQTLAAIGGIDGVLQVRKIEQNGRLG